MTAAGYFVAGTDTGVGKTMVMAALVTALREAGQPAVPLKPIQTGTTDGRSPDLDVCLAAIDEPISPELYDLLAPYRFELAASPHLAAQREVKRVDVAHIVYVCDEVKKRGLVPVVEGAGGVLAPVNDDQYMADVIAALGLPIVLVARPGLGTLNHTLLSVAELRRRNLGLTAIVLSQPSADWGVIEVDNLQSLRRRIEGVTIVPFPCVDARDRAALARAGGELLAAFNV